MSAWRAHARPRERADGVDDELRIFIEVGPRTDPARFAAVVAGLERTCTVTLLHPLPTRWYEWLAASGGQPVCILRDEERLHATRLCHDLARLVPTDLACEVVVGESQRATLRRHRRRGGAPDVLILTQPRPARRRRAPTSAPAGISA